MQRQNTAPRRAIVVGAGIGGPVVAMALQRAGVHARVYEAFPRTAEESGLFLNLASNGLGALRTLGFDSKLLSAAFPTPKMVMWSGTGKRLGEVTNGTTLDDGTVSVTIRRAALQRVLADEAERRGIEIAYDKRVADVTSSADGVHVRFEDGTCDAADFLVGADGIHSKTRRLVDPACPEPRYTGQASLGGVLPSSGLEPTPGRYQMIFGRRAFFGYSVTKQGDAYWFANVALEPEPSRETLRAVPTDEWKALLVALFEGDAGPALEIVGRTERIYGYPIHDLPRVPHWHRDKMVIIGDAAHATSPSSGQGASMAIEDAVVLAKHVRDEPDLTVAFARYVAARRARVERVVRYSKQIGSSKVPGPVGRWFRDLLMPVALKVFASEGAHAWLYDNTIDWNERTA